MTIYYCHLAKREVTEGQTIRRGERIGIEGTTGQSTGVHLHFEVRHGSEKLNAADYLGIPNEPGTYRGDPAESKSASAVIDALAVRITK